MGALALAMYLRLRQSRRSWRIREGPPAWQLSFLHTQEKKPEPQTPKAAAQLLPQAWSHHLCTTSAASPTAAHPYLCTRTPAAAAALASLQCSLAGAYVYLSCARCNLPPHAPPPSSPPPPPHGTKSAGACLRRRLPLEKGRQALGRGGGGGGSTTATWPARQQKAGVHRQPLQASWLVTCASERARILCLACTPARACLLTRSLACLLACFARVLSSAQSPGGAK